MKNYILVLLAVLGLGFLATPANTQAEMVSASDEAIVADATADLNEIMPIEKKDTAEIAVKGEISTPVATVRVASATSGATSATTGANYTVTAASSSIVYDPENEVYHTGNLLYAHAYKAFKTLKNFGVGSIMSISENGVISTYRVSEVKYFLKTGDRTLALCSNGLNDCNVNTPMASIMGARYVDENHIRHSHSLALMTCAGTNDSHRLVVFVDKM